MKKMKSSLLCIIYLSFIIIGINPIISSHSSVQVPPSSGDWVITGSETLSGDWLLNGSIIITSTGILNVQNAKITFMGVENGGLSHLEWNITILEGGSLTILNSNITSDGPGYRWYLGAHPGSTLSIQDSEFSFGGESPYAMIHIETSDVTIAGSKFTSATFATITGHNTSNLTITDCTILATFGSGGIRLNYMDNTVITNCDITSDNGACLIYIFWSSNTIVQDSTIIHDDSPYIPVYLDNTSSTSFIRNTFYCEFSTGPTAIVADLFYLDTDILIDSNSFDMHRSSSQEIINLRKVERVTISNNDFAGAANGIEIESHGPQDITITGNTFTKHSSRAIRLLDTTMATISNNIIEDTVNRGIECIDCDEITISDNDISEIVNSAIILSSCNNTEILTNDIATCGAEAIAISGMNNANITIQNNNIENSATTGILISTMLKIVIKDNNLKTLYGNAVDIRVSSNIEIDRNVFDDIRGDTIYLEGCSKINVTENGFHNCRSQSVYTVTCASLNISSNTFNLGYDGIFCSTSTNGIIQSNIFKRNSRYAIYIASNSFEIDIMSNIFTENNNGIYLVGDNNSVTNNSFLFNLDGIILSVSAEGNLITFNDFIENTNQATDEGSGNYFSLNLLSIYFGNYWSDYTGIDVVDPSGFGDTPYDAILGASGTVDNFPLMNPYIPSVIAPPVITHPADLNYTESTTGHLIIWQGLSYTPDRYSASIDGLITEDVWEEEPIILSVDGLNVGTHEVICTLYDKLGNSISDVVQITVLDVSGSTPGTSETTTTLPVTTSGDTPTDFVPGFVVGILASFGVIAISFVGMRIIRRKKA